MKESKSGKESRSGEKSKWAGLEKELMGILNNLVNDITLMDNTDCETNRIFNNSINKIIQTMFEAVLEEAQHKKKEINTHCSECGAWHFSFIEWEDIRNLLSGKGEGK